MDLLLSLPDDLWYSILTFASAPTERAAVLCSRVAPLCSALRESVDRGRPGLWSAVLDEYGGGGDAVSSRKRRRTSTTIAPPPARSSARLRPASKKDEVRAAHARLLDRTVIAHRALTELTRTAVAPTLTLGGLRWIFAHHGPSLSCDRRFSDPTSYSQGDTFLVECCRAAGASERIVLSCAKELVSERGARPDGPPPSSSRRTTPLCVAAARGMPSVVRFLLDSGADPRVEGADRFPIRRRPSRSVSGTFAPLRIAKIVLDAKIEQQKEGVDARSEIRSLRACVRILEQAEKG